MALEGEAAVTPEVGGGSERAPECRPTNSPGRWWRERRRQEAGETHGEQALQPPGRAPQWGQATGSTFIMGSLKINPLKIKFRYI